MKKTIFSVKLYILNMSIFKLLIQIHNKES